jgi:hypothetical protein
VADKKTVEQAVEATEASKESVPVYTEEQARDIYNEGQKSGYVAAIRNIRANLNDYLNDLIIAAEAQNKAN